MKFMLTYSCSHNKKSSTQKIQVIITLEAKGFRLSRSKTEYTEKPSGPLLGLIVMSH
jgi:hypothetical protein